MLDFCTKLNVYDLGWVGAGGGNPRGRRHVEIATTIVPVDLVKPLRQSILDERAGGSGDAPSSRPFRSHRFRADHVPRWGWRALFLALRCPRVLPWFATTSSPGRASPRWCYTCSRPRRVLGTATDPSAYQNRGPGIRIRRPLFRRMSESFEAGFRRLTEAD